MNLVVFGARGDVGSRIVSEALFRGHQVTAVVRSKAQIASLPSGVTAKVADISKQDQTDALMAGQDAAISAVRPPDGQEDALVPLTRAVLNAGAATTTRAIIVGGAASLALPGGSGHTVLTAPDFLPDDVLPIARACQAQYELCEAENRTDWTYLCPPAMLSPGTRTGVYQTGTDTLVADEDGNSAISMEDFAVALLDEVENPVHHRARFTVAH